MAKTKTVSSINYEDMCQESYDEYSQDVEYDECVDINHFDEEEFEGLNTLFAYFRHIDPGYVSQCIIKAYTKEMCVVVDKKKNGTIEYLPDENIMRITPRRKGRGEDVVLTTKEIEMLLK